MSLKRYSILSDVAGSLTELAPVRVDQQREMRKLWSGETERVVQLQLRGEVCLRASLRPRF
jgi:hypothetical protein